MIIDTHIHLDDERYAEDFDKVIARAKEGGVEKFIIPGADPTNLDRAVELADKYDEIYFAVGAHPYDLDSFESIEFEKYMSHPKCVAIGECGLDYFRLEGTTEEKEKVKARQADVFSKHIEIAKKYKKPLIVHIRDASHDAKVILQKCGSSEVGGVLHCFNADEELLSLANDGFYFGIGGVLTFKNAKKLLNVLPQIPTEKLLIETDGPYLTPHPHRGERNEPFYCTLVASKIAEILDLDEQNIANMTTKNAQALFQL
ncbi:MAG: YchF/TatD family DNA exonuclease [Helicobacteraceae bacterium]|nr:YchF/TatD family DNA exonuclease [Helicobacteraceae bacterium]